VEFAVFDLPTIEAEHKTWGKDILSTIRTYAKAIRYEQRK
jgi:hypothetical protein